MEQFKVAEEVAVAEVKEFIEYHTDEEISSDLIVKDYKAVVKAVMRGLLNLNDQDAPVLTLLKPIEKQSGGVDTAQVTFLTRVKKSQLAAISKGLDMGKESVAFSNRLMAYLIQQPTVAYLDYFGKQDMKVIEQVAGLFL